MHAPARSRIRPRVLALAAFALALLFGAAELAARALGVLDFPLYRLDPDTVYVVAPSQNGTFFGGRTWAYNEYGMSGGPLTGGRSGKVLVVGDSVVEGGFGTDRREKVQGRLADILPGRVWSIATGGWAFLNEVAWLKRHRDLLTQFDTLVLVCNSADFEGYGPWSAAGYPVSRPVSALIYAAQRRFFADGPPDLGVYSPALTDEMRAGWRHVLGGFDGRILIVKHSLAPELSSRHPGFEAVVAELVALSSGRAEVVEAASDPRWNAALYKDIVHITPQGNAVMAAIIADALGRSDQHAARRDAPLRP
jgi:hypothetical protein